jgi:hypothetical protein
MSHDPTRAVSVNLCLAALLLLVLLIQPPARAAVTSPKPTAPRIFVFHADEFWLNLHHFLYVLGRAQNKTRDSSREAVVHAPEDQGQGLAKLKPAEQTIWQEAVAAYANTLSKSDLVFDDSLAEITNALVTAGHKKSLADSGIDPAVVDALTKAAPIYRKAWWSKHRAANEAWEVATEALVKKNGSKILDFITGAYRMEWPTEGYNVHISAYANWAGAYSTKGNLLVLSSLSEATQRDDGLEIVFHEGMHQWDDQIEKILNDEAKRVRKPVPRNLSHALIFFTAGEAVKHVIPDHVPYADKFGVWQRGMTREKDVLYEIWRPYLNGSSGREESLREMIKRL